MKQFLVQMLSAENGNRSQPFVTDIDKLAMVLRHSDLNHDDYIIVIARVDDTEEEQFDWVTSPVFTIRTFLISQFPEDWVEVTGDSDEPPHDPSTLGEFAQ